MLRVDPISSADRVAWLSMRLALYPEEPVHIIESEIDSFLSSGMIADREHCVLFARQHDRPVGFLEVSEFGHDRCHVESWYVTPQSRGSGVGRALIEACERWASARHAKVLTSDTNEDYPDSPPAHKACGFYASDDDTLFEKRLDAQS